MNDPDVIRHLLTEAITWAVVGASPNPNRPSHGVMGTLISRGKDVIPVNPEAEAVYGRPAVSSLYDIEERIDVVDIFRHPRYAGAHVDEAIAVGAAAVWMQLGVIDRAAAARAEAAGLDVVMDRCPAIEFRRLS